MEHLKNKLNSSRYLTCIALSAFLAIANAALAAQADLSRMVIVGDSLLAGYQNGSLRGCQQIHGIPSLIAQQAGVTLPLPLIADPGIPNAMVLLDPGPPSVVSRLSGTSAGRIYPMVQPYNLCVPGHTVEAALGLRPDLPFDSLTDLVLGLPGMLGGACKSQVEWAEALQPTTIIVWIGPNDTLGAALKADASLVTPEARFTAAYAEMMRRLAAVEVPIVVANIPDVTVIPYLTSADDLAVQAGYLLSIVGPVLGIASGDYVTPDALPYIQAILTGKQAGPLPGNVVLTAEEVETIRVATERFNACIAEQAKLYGAALVDTHGFLNAIKERGIVVHGQRLTADYLGGVFSLDGIHPTNTGAAATANEFIHALNTHFHAGIPPVNVVKVAEEDPLVLPGVGHPASALTHIDQETVEDLHAAMSY